MTLKELCERGFVEHHRCGACNSPVGYEMHPEMVAAVFNSGCECGGGATYRLLTWEELRAISSPGEDERKALEELARVERQDREELELELKKYRDADAHLDLI